MTRLIAGTARGRRLVVPKGLATRPTSDKVRGAIMNLLGQFFEGGEVLDLYAGSGALALEALSRGYSRATCVDRDARALEAVRKNAEACRFGDRVEIVRGELPESLSRLPANRYALAFVDPPYGDGPEAALEGLDRLLVPFGIAVAEHGARNPPPGRVGGLSRIDLRSYGGTGISIYRRE